MAKMNNNIRGGGSERPGMPKPGQRPRPIPDPARPGWGAIVSGLNKPFPHKGEPGFDAGHEWGGNRPVRPQTGAKPTPNRPKPKNPSYEPGGDVWRGKHEPLGGWKAGTHGKDYKAPAGAGPSPSTSPIAAGPTPFAAPWLQGYAGGGGWMPMDGGGYFNPQTWQSWKPGDPIPGMAGGPSSGGVPGGSGGSFEEQVYAQLLKSFGGI